MTNTPTAFNGTAIGEHVVEVIKAYINRRLQALEHKMAEIETRGVEFRGVHQRACDYRRGSMVVDDGSLWAAVRDAKAGETPGNSDAWQLCAKAGRSAR